MKLSSCVKTASIYLSERGFLKVINDIVIIFTSESVRLG